MSATELKNRVCSVLDEQIEKYATISLNLRRDPGMIGKNVSVAPSTPEDIAMIVLEANAFRRGIEAARNCVVEEHQALIAPDSIPSGAGEEQKDVEESLY